MVINDEAHHIHENKIYGEVKEVEWQRSLNKISKNKGNQFIQIDFLLRHMMLPVADKTG